ncbi:MAG TPA: Ni/Fe-hydrogenase cytochrome b subunit [Mycobacterium sp.]|nr:Ni/Fe-hydrogenase cytochrome b subunit [Mycobacterium sp.]
MSNLARTLPRAAHDDWIVDKIFLGYSRDAYVRSLLTPWNAIVALILVTGLPVIAYRFLFGLGAVTNLSQTTPWGLWISLDVLGGVALAAGGYSMALAVYVFRMEQFHPVVRPAVLTGFLGYFFVVVGLLCDLGLPWHLPVPMVYSFGTLSVMFEVAWCVCLYLIVLALEFTPPVFEWLNWPRARAIALKATIPLTIVGFMLSTMHQSSLGALFLIAKDKVHPLWYSPSIPLFFFVSSIVAGLSMVIFESAISHRLFHDRLDPNAHVDVDAITVGLARGASVVLFAYFFLKLQGLIESQSWNLLNTSYGYWWLFEMLGFILAPAFLYAYGARHRYVRLLRGVAAWTVVGIVVNRLNVSIVALNWSRPTAYVPTLYEVMVSVTIVTIGIQVFRWIVNRMPVLRDDPAFPVTH